MLSYVSGGQVANRRKPIRHDVLATSLSSRGLVAN